MTDLKKVSEALNTYLRPQTFPVAVRLCKSADELPERVRIPRRDLGIDISLCHAIALAKRYGWTIAVDKEQTCYVPGISLGFWTLPPDVVDGSFQETAGLWGMSKEQAAASIANLPKFEYGTYQYALMAPVDRATFEPHVIIFYGTPAQIWVLLAGYTSGTGSQVNITLSTGGGCTNTITRTIQEEQAKFVIVGTGERLVPNTQDYECAFSVPFTKIEKTIEGLERGYRTGVFRYPIPSFLRYGSQHPPGYAEMRSHILEYMSEDKS
jgi:uncharacterized protein (DUF169 family)